MYRFLFMVLMSVAMITQNSVTAHAAYTIADAVESTLKHNQNLKAMNESVEVAKSRTQGDIFKSFLPSVNLQSTFAHTSLEGGGYATIPPAGIDALYTKKDGYNQIILNKQQSLNSNCDGTASEPGYCASERTNIVTLVTKVRLLEEEIADAEKKATKIPYEKIPYDKTYNLDHTVSVSQNLFAFGRDFYKVKQGKALENVEKVKYSAEGINKTLLNVVGTYQSIIALRYKYFIYKEQTKMQYKLLQTIKARYQAGSSTVIDIANIQAGLAKNEAEQQKILSDLKAYEASFFNLVGDVPPVQMHQIDISHIALPQNLETQSQLFAKHDPSIAQAQYALQAQRYEYNAAKTSIFPNVNLEYQYNVHSIKSVVNSSAPTDKDQSVSFSVTTPLLPLAQYTGIQSAKHAAQSAKYSLNAAKTSAWQNSIALWYQYKYLAQALEAQKSLIKHKQIYADGMKIRFDIGGAILTDLLNAQNDLLTAKQGLLETYNNIVNAVLSIRMSTGTRLDKIKFKDCVGPIATKDKAPVPTLKF